MPPPDPSPVLTCLLSPVHLAQNGSYFILLNSGIQGHWEWHFNNLPVVNSKRGFVFYNLNYYALLVYFQVFIDSTSFGYLKRARPSMSQIIRFFFYACFFLSVSPVAEPKITEERRLTVITPSLPLESSTAGSLVPPLQEPPAHISQCYFMSGAHTPLNGDFFLPVRLVISENYHQNQDGMCTVKHYCGAILNLR